MLWEATSISLAIDESKYSKIVSFRADLPSASSARLGPGSQWRQVGAAGFSQSGVLGVIDCSKKHATDFEDGYGRWRATRASNRTC